MRKLSKLALITDVIKHDNADALEIYMVNGWRCIDVLGRYKIGDKVIFIEPDAFITKDLSKYSYLPLLKTINNITGYRIKTCKLRGIVSQGLLLPYDEFYKEYNIDFEIDLDVSEQLGIMNYQKLLEIEFQSKTATYSDARGPFPSNMNKTDQERFQNIISTIIENNDLEFEVSLKMDGLSLSLAYQEEDGVHICSRNYDLLLDRKTPMITTIQKSDIYNKFSNGEFGSIALFGELCGPGIQGNKEQFSSYKWFIFDIYDIKTKRYYNSEERLEFCEKNQLNHAPIIHNCYKIKSTNINDGIKELLHIADIKGINGVTAEGVVFKALRDKPNMSKLTFKVINERFLLKEK